MIRLANISKLYDPRGIAGVHDVSLNLPKGKLMALMGPNGSGKSTLLKLISGQLAPDSGKLHIPSAVHLFQSEQPKSDMNVQSFLKSKVTLTSSDEKKTQLARDMAHIFEFTFQLRQNLSELSHGQRQKVFMASELINHPELVLLDEPFNHLDPVTRKDILNALFEYMKQKELTIIWVTHDINEALRHADLLGILNFGQLEQFSTADELVRTPKNLFVAQFMGYQNFIPLTRYNPEAWLTPWGPWTHSQYPDLNEAYLVLPLNAWKTDSLAAFELTLKSVCIQELQWELEGDHQGKSYVLRFPFERSKTFSPGQKLKLSPAWEECFLIPI